jgi:hypothetical protein
VSSIVQEVAGRHDLGTAIDGEIGGHYVEHIDQTGESDMGFLTRLAKRHGATFKVANGTIIFAKKGSTTLPSGIGKPAITVRPVDVASWTVNAGERGAHELVICYWHDHDTGRRRAARAGKADKGGKAHRDKRLYATQAEAEAAARAQLGELTRGQKTGQIECVGNPAFFAEGVVVLDGFDPDADGQFYAKTVTHNFSASGYTTSVSLETTKSDPDGEGD